ncbi:hypothetical protein AYO41_02550 [Verrucomicrobia bacterium SCGC AG-212-E04]|nr:hypothetical protein AYO41_02550 [Verrucomicrobia bacterium SCGC AG-212-E04]
MRLLQHLIGVFGVVALLLTNSDLSLPYRKGIQHPEGSDVVSVYTIEEETSSVPTVPVQRSLLTRKDGAAPEHSLTDTGQRVRVYIMNSFLYDAVRQAHRNTVKTLAFFVVLYIAVALLRYWRNRRSRI